MHIIQESGPHKSGQNTDFQRVYVLTNGDRLRVRISLDSAYEVQTRAHAERWDGTQWHNVLTWDGRDPLIKSLPSGYARIEDSERKNAFIATANTMMLAASDVILV